jgi:hypothetical protein
MRSEQEIQEALDTMVEFVRRGGLASHPAFAEFESQVAGCMMALHWALGSPPTKRKRANPAEGILREMRAWLRDETDPERN